MFSRVLNRVRSPDGSSTGQVFKVHGQQESARHGQSEPLETFYRNLVVQLCKLESGFDVNDSSTGGLKVEWLLSGVTFLQTIHGESFNVLERVWLQSKPSIAPDSLTDYLDMSMSLLDICNNLKEALSQLEFHQMAMDLVMRRLLKTTTLLQESNCPSPDLSSYRQALLECKQEMSRLEATEASSSWTWTELMPKFNVGERLSRINSTLARTNSAFLPLTSTKKTEMDVSLLLFSVQLVTSFISCVLTWILCGPAGEQISPAQVQLSLCVEAHRKEQMLLYSTWLKYLNRMYEKVEETMRYKGSSHGSRLYEVISLQNSLKEVLVKLEDEIQIEEVYLKTDYDKKITNLLNLEKEKLQELTVNLEKVAGHLDQMFHEITERRRRVLEICVKRPLNHAFSI